MLSAEDNEILTRVGPGTPIGSLLRRYWMPACLSAEIRRAGRPAGPGAAARRGPGRVPGHRRRGRPHRGALPAPRRVAVLRPQRGVRAALHVPRLEVRRHRPVRRPALRAAPVLAPDQDHVLPDPRVRRDRVDLPGAGGYDDAVPRLRHRVAAGGPGRANKELIYCNWVQSMDGDLDTAHISNLHQFDAIDDVPDDGTDKPGYPSGYMSMRFWRHDPRALIEVDDAWHGFRYAGIRVTPNGYRHARVTAYIFPSIDDHRADPVLHQADLRGAVRRRDHVPVQLHHPAAGQPARLRRPAVLHLREVPVRDAAPGRRRAPHLHAGERLPDLPGGPEGHVLQRHRRLPFAGRHGDGDRGPDLRPDGGAPRVDRRGADPHAPPAAARRQGPGGGAATRPGRPARLGGSGDFQAIRGAEKVLADGEDWRVLGTDADPTVRETLSLREG